ncbi:M48 family metallopeptidase [Haloarcula amylovorans]|uniref:M48 family metallopeptidase n=1 Tax=Haloarcula amylovorans TaxID=2562280 RepID=UPI0010763F2C|nr:M48 family metalloprotease [Halomicroarcula amylolytica]
MSPSTPTTWRLRARLLALGAVLVAFDIVAVAAAYVLAHVAFGLAPLFAYQYDHLFWTMSFDYVPLWVALAVGTPLTLVVQSVFGYRMTLRDALADGERTAEQTPDSVAAMREKIDRSATARTVSDRVERLAYTANMTTPDVSVIESAAPNSFVAGRPGEQTLFVTTTLLERLDDDELDAVLAHELAHLKNGDAFVMTAAAFLPAVTTRFNAALGRYLTQSVLAGWFLGRGETGGEETNGDDDDDSSHGFTQADFAMIPFALVAMPTVAALYLASTACYRLLSRIREYSADAGGVAICGSPAALAGALETLTGDQRPTADVRAAQTGVRELCVLPYAIANGESETPTTRAARIAHRWNQFCERVLPDSHPDVTDRLDALGARQTDLDGRDGSAR